MTRPQRRTARQRKISEIQAIAAAGIAALGEQQLDVARDQLQLAATRIDALAHGNRHVEHPAKSAKRGVQDPRFCSSLETGLTILALFTAKRPILGIAEIADELGLHRSTTHRFVATLSRCGYLTQDGVAKRRYRLAVTQPELPIA
jgi:Fic family protein